MPARPPNDVDLSVYKPEIDGLLLLNERYELSEFLSQGGMGRLYIAKDKVLNRQVVVKILLPQYLDNQKFAKRFEREAQTLSKINHPHLLNVYDYGVYKENYPYIVTEYIRGVSLGEMIGDRGRIPLGETVEILTQVCDGLHAAHQQDIVHRDMKPENILVTKGGDDEWIKVIDFGLAVENFQEQTRLTVSGSFLGTMPYMAPEQFDHADVDARTDVYAVGVIFFEMLTGSHPYHATSIHQFYLQHAEASIPKLADSQPPIDTYIPELQDILEKALAKRPEERYPNMIAFKRDLRMAVGARVSDATYSIADAVRGDLETRSGPRQDPTGIAWIKRQLRKTGTQLGRLKLLIMMLGVAFATAMGVLAFEKSVFQGMPTADITSLTAQENVKSREFYDWPGVRVRIKGTARNCQDRVLMVEVRAMDADGRPLPLQIPTDRSTFRRWPHYKKESGHFGYTFEAKPEEAFFSISRVVDLPYDLFVPQDAPRPFTYFVSARVITARREALALRDTDFLTAPTRDVAAADVPTAVTTIPVVAPASSKPSPARAKATH
ncbi:MAG: serine/threonine protein kinase [Verrucomicrobiae bacterium]|nr:serine/threonine protein kinase [Verrucomicrobiae bacterium]